MVHITMALHRQREMENVHKIVEDGFLQLERCWNAEEITKDCREGRREVIVKDLKTFFIQKVEEERQHLIKQKILSVRNELVHWWNKCFFNDSERLEFQEFTSEDYSQHLLDRHLDEIHTLKRYYNNNKTILELVRKHQEMWQRVMDVEKQQYNPERLFQNRGAQLLQEEKDRKTAQKDLPRLEEQIKKLTEAFEKQNRRPFLVYGQRFSEVIKLQKEQHKENQKALKSARKNCSQNEVPSAVKTVKKMAPPSAAKQIPRTAPRTAPKPTPKSARALQRTGAKTAPKRKLSHSSTPSSAPFHKIAKVNGLQRSTKIDRLQNIRPKKTVRRKLLEKNSSTQKNGCTSSSHSGFQPLSHEAPYKFIKEEPLSFIKQEPSSFIKQEYSCSFQNDIFNSLKTEPTVFIKREPAS